jgi:hypothetical protein
LFKFQQAIKDPTLMVNEDLILGAVGVQSKWTDLEAVDFEFVARRRGVLSERGSFEY